MDNLIFTKSSRGGSMLYYNDFIYYKDKNDDGNISTWRCKQRKNKNLKCKGYVRLMNKDSIFYEEKHNHANEHKEIEKSKIMEKIKQKALLTKESTLEIISSSITRVSTEFIACLPHYKSIRDNVKRKRNKLINYIAKDFTDIPENLKKDMNGDLFFRYDSGFDKNDRFLIFCSKYKEVEFLTLKNFLIDGTFKISAAGFYQLITIHAIFLGKSYPFIYILLKNKKEESYCAAFEICKILFKIEPNFIMTDFELGLINAIKKIFPNSIHKGCNFHFSQAIWRKIQEFGYASLYIKNSNFYNIIRRLFSLAFLKDSDIFNEYLEVKADLLDLKLHDVSSFINYLDRTYFGYFNEFEFVEPSFELSFWSIYHCILNGLPRTNNSVEAWHKGINQNIILKKPNIALFIDKILESESKDKIEIVQKLTGKIEFVKVNHVKEYKLLVLARNYSLLKKNNYLLALKNVYNWKFDKYNE